MYCYAVAGQVRQMMLESDVMYLQVKSAMAAVARLCTPPCLIFRGGGGTWCCVPLFTPSPCHDSVSVCAFSHPAMPTNAFAF